MYENMFNLISKQRNVNETNKEIVCIAYQTDKENNYVTQAIDLLVFLGKV